MFISPPFLSNVKLYDQIPNYDLNLFFKYQPNALSFSPEISNFIRSIQLKEHFYFPSSDFPTTNLIQTNENVKSIISLSFSSNQSLSSAASSILSSISNQLKNIDFDVFIRTAFPNKNLIFTLLDSNLLLPKQVNSFFSDLLASPQTYSIAKESIQFLMNFLLSKYPSSSFLSTISLLGLHSPKILPSAVFTHPLIKFFS